MIKNKIIFKRAARWVSVFVILTLSPLGFAQEPVTIKVLAVHHAGNIQYSYQVSNHTRARSIVSVSIGNGGVQPAGAGSSQPELFIYPVGSFWGEPIASGDQRGETPRRGGAFASPLGWVGKIQEYEETTDFSVDWNINENITSNFPVIYPGQTLSFGVTVPFNDDPRSIFSMIDPEYLTGHFTVGFDHSNAINEGPAFWNYTGTIVPIDTTPPVFSITSTPATLWPPNNKMVAVSAAITVKDDYDPQPEIKLESIIANEMLMQGDIQGAVLGTDDRQFSLAATREGANPAGRVYTLTYSATDGSGNKSTASTTVTVPHDQR